MARDNILIQSEKEYNRLVYAMNNGVRKLINDNEKLYEAFRRLGMVFYENKKYYAALVCFEKSLELNHEDNEILIREYIPKCRLHNQGYKVNEENWG